MTSLLPDNRSFQVPHGWSVPHPVWTCASVEFRLFPMLRELVATRLPSLLILSLLLHTLPARLLILAVPILEVVPALQTPNLPIPMAKLLVLRLRAVLRLFLSLLLPPLRLKRLQPLPALLSLSQATVLFNTPHLTTLSAYLSLVPTLHQALMWLMSPPVPQPVLQPTG